MRSFGIVPDRQGSLISDVKPDFHENKMLTLQN